MAVRPVDLQDSSKSATVVRSDSAVMDLLARDDRSRDCCRFVGLTGRAGQVSDAVNIELTALRSVEGWAEVGWGALESCG